MNWQLSKKEIIDNLLALVIVLAFLLIPSYFYSNVIRANSILNIVNADFYKHIDDVEIVVLGNSHNLSAINPEQLEKSFNFSFGGESYVQSYYKLQHLLEHTEHKIDTAILSFDLTAFAANDYGQKSNLFYWHKYINYWELASYTGNYSYYLGEFLEGHFFPYANSFKKVFHYFSHKTLELFGARVKKSKSEKTPRIKGFKKTAIKKTFADKSKEKKTRAAKRRVDFLLKHGFKDELLLHYFHKTMTLAKKHKLKVVLLAPPVTKEYWEEAGKQVSLSSFNEMLQALRKEYPDALYLDYHELFFSKPEYFKNADHINYRGARILSDLVRQELIKNSFVATIH